MLRFSGRKAKDRGYHVPVPADGRKPQAAEQGSADIRRIGAPRLQRAASSGPQPDVGGCRRVRQERAGRVVTRHACSGVIRDRVSLAAGPGSAVRARTRQIMTETSAGRHLGPSVLNSGGR